MNPELLIVDDHPHIRELLEMTFTSNGYTVRTAGSGVEAMEQVRRKVPDLIVLDVMLDDTTGIKLTSRLKKAPETAQVPIVLLTARDGESDMIQGLSAGADDYVTKPFSSGVLLARIEALLRRSQVRPAGASILAQRIVNVENLSVSPEVGLAFLDNTPLELTPSEFSILMALIAAAPGHCTREELLGKIGAGSGEQGERLVDVHIASLRKKLDKSRHLIKTVRGRGYRLRAAVAVKP